jgi:hypothetical protein
MAERKESSVLFSLRELRSIEEERIQEEDAAKRRAEEEKVRAREDAERRTREEEESRRRAIEDAERRERETREQRERDDRLRVEEAERRARVEAQASLEQQRMHKELEIRAVEAQRKKPTWLIAVAGGLVIAVGLLGFWAYNKSQESDRKEREAAARLESLQQEMATTQGDIDKLLKEKDAEFQKLLAANTAEEKAAAQKALDAKNREIAAKQDALKDLRDKAKGGGGGGGGGGKTPKEDKGVKIKCDPNDPLCGI